MFVTWRQCFKSSSFIRSEGVWEEEVGRTREGVYIIKVYQIACKDTTNEKNDKGCYNDTYKNSNGGSRVLKFSRHWEPHIVPDLKNVTYDTHKSRIDTY